MEQAVTPFQIEILFHYYTWADDSPAVKLRPPILESTMQWFADQDLIMPSSVSDPLYLITDRGRAWCEHVCGLRLPDQKLVWAMA